MYIITTDNANPTVYVGLVDSSTGLPKTGLVFNSGGALAYYTRPRASATAITLATQTVTGAWSAGGFVEVDAVNAKGLYRLDLPTAATATAADYAIVSVSFTGVKTEHLLVFLDSLPTLTIVTVQSDAGNSATQFKTDLSSATNNFYKDSLFLFVTGALTGQQKLCTSYAGGTKIATVNALTGTPANGDKAVLINR